MIWTRVSRPIWLAVVVGVMLAATTQSARATCGDWLAHPVSADAEQADSADQMAANVPRPPSPCEGGHCHQSPSLPAVPPAPVEIGSRVGPLAVVNRDSALLSALSARDLLALETGATAVAGFPATIERPPRG